MADKNASPRRLAPLLAGVFGVLDVVRRARRPLWCAATLAPVFAAVYYFSFWLRFEGRLGNVELREFTLTVVWVVLIVCKALRTWSQTVQALFCPNPHCT